MYVKYRKPIYDYEQESLFSSFDQGTYQKDNDSSFSSFESLNVSQLPSFRSRTKNQSRPIERKQNNYKQIINSKVNNSKKLQNQTQISHARGNHAPNRQFLLPKNTIINFEEEYYKNGRPLDEYVDQNKQINRINMPPDRNIPKNIDLPLKLSQQRDLKSKYDDLVKIKDQIVSQNHYLRKENESLKEKLNKIEDCEKKIDCLNKQNNFLRIEVQKLKSRQSAKKINVDISNKNDMLLEVQRLHQKCRLIQNETREQMRVKQQEMKIKYQHQIRRIKGIGSWRDKFVQVFLDMLQKIPIEIDPQWSKKKKVRIGWQSVKLLIKKSLKFGIPPPNIQVVE